MRSTTTKYAVIIGATLAVLGGGALAIGSASASEPPATGIVLAPAPLDPGDDVELREVPEDEAVDLIAQQYGVSRAEAARAFAQAKAEAAARPRG